jgi:hypothetical protein
MSPESFAKLTLLKKIIGQMSIAEKMAFIANVRWSKLPPDALKTSDGQHAYSEENFLAVALLTLVADDREEFERIGGFYGTGYRSELRQGLYHGKGEIPSKDWQREIRRLHHLIKSVSSELKLPELREYPVREVPPDDLYVRPTDDAWKESKFDAVVACQ